MADLSEMIAKLEGATVLGPERKLEVIRQATDMLLRSAAVAEREVEPCHWIGDADDQSESYCYDCAAKVVEQKSVKAQPGGELFVDGGWRGEHDTPPFCEGCGVKLEYSPTDYCIGEEIGHFLDFWNDAIDADTALELTDIFDAVVSLGNPIRLRTWLDARRCEAAESNLDGAFTLAERVISALAFPTGAMDRHVVWGDMEYRSSKLADTIAALKARATASKEPPHAA